MKNQNENYLPEALDVSVVSKSFTGESGVNARALHKYLEVGRDFSNWIKNKITEFEFEENVDYVMHKFDMHGNLLSVSLPKTGESDTQEDKHNQLNIRLAKTGESDIQAYRIEYEISMDMAKELAMVEKTPKGKQARKYYIALEKYLKDIKYSLNVFHGKEWITIYEYCNTFNLSHQSFHGSKSHYKHYFGVNSHNVEIVHARVCHMRAMRQKIEGEKKILRSPELLQQLQLEFPQE